MGEISSAKTSSICFYVYTKKLSFYLNHKTEEEKAAAILQGAALKEEKAAADRQAAATYREMADVLQKLEKNPSSRADLDRLPILYVMLAAQATDSEKKTALPVIVNVMRKLGLKVPGD